MHRELIRRPAVARELSTDLQAAVTHSLFRSGYAALNFIGCEVIGDRVVLCGCVPTYHLKQLAQTFVQRVAGVGRVDNRLAVRHSGERRWSARLGDARQAPQ